jgi:VanZ family protein
MAGTLDPSTPGDQRGPVRGGFLTHVLPALLWTLAIFIGGGSGMPQPEVSFFELPFGFDKVQHVLAFGALQALCFRALRYELPERRRRGLLWLAAFMALLAGIGLELYQLGLPDRSADVADAAADGVGAALGALLLDKLPWL